MTNPNLSTPEKLLGVPTESIAKFGQVGMELGILPANARLGVVVMEDAVMLLPLMEQVAEKAQDGQLVTPEEVKPHSDQVRRVLKKVGRTAGFGAKVRLGLRLPKRIVNRRIEKEFPARAPEVIEASRPSLESLSSSVETIGQFENPKKQFDQEVRYLVTETKDQIYKARTERLANPAVTEPELPKMEGFKGAVVNFALKAVRKVKQFFGFLGRIFGGKPKVNPEITAYDAAQGIINTFQNFTNNKATATREMPLVAGLSFDRLPKVNMPSAYELAFVVPEILEMLFSLSGKNKENDKLLASVTKNPHELRFVARYKKQYGKFNLNSAQRAALDLLPAIRDILPENGRQFQAAYQSLIELIQPTK